MSCSVHVQQYSSEFEGVAHYFAVFDLVLTAGASRRLFCCTMFFPPSSSFGTQTTGHGGFNEFIASRTQKTRTHAARASRTTSNWAGVSFTFWDEKGREGSEGFSLSNLVISIRKVQFP